mgnify:CR=1 FL=1
MPEHYYSETPSSAHAVQAFDIVHAGKTLHFETDAGVFSKGHLDKGTALLLEAVPEVFSGRALDLGCGWGPVGVCMASQWPEAEIVMTDVNGRAAELSRKNIAANKLAATVYQGDGLSHIPGSFDLIATNPPIRAGKSVMYRLFAESMERLLPGGALYVVIRKQQGADSAQKYLQTLSDDVSIVARGSGFRVLRAIREK